jgi:excisionase family DNA binding protein
VEDETEQAESAPIFADELLTLEDVAKWLRLKKLTVRNMMSRGLPSALYLGHRRGRVRRSELERFLAAGEPGRHVVADRKPTDLEARLRMSYGLRTQPTWSLRCVPWPLLPSGWLTR